MAKKTKPPAAQAADEIVRWPLSKLTALPQNAREHSADQIKMLVASIEEFGFVMPVLVDEKGVIIAGHGRVKAAEERGMDHVPVIVARGWSPARKRAYALADNRIAEAASWDRLKLGTELGNLQSMGVDLSLLGWNPGELKQLIANAIKPGADPDDAPETPEGPPVSKLGDLWVLGQHRVLCGDATKAEDVARVLAGNKPNLMVTDPPYGVSYEPNWRNEARRALGGKIGARATGKVANDDIADWRGAWALFPGAVAYVWHAGRYCAEVAESLKAAKFIPRSQIVWVKSNFAIGRGDYHWGHEPAYYATKEGKADHWQQDHEVAAYNVKLGETGSWAGDRKQSTVWDDIAHKITSKHATQKPVECMRRPILNNSRGGDAVYDPFLGSGTTIIAAQMEGRLCYGLELDPRYIDVIVERWAAFTNLEPIHEATGKTFSELKGARSGKEKQTARRSERRGKT